jgi:hypothetical protein
VEQAVADFYLIVRGEFLSISKSTEGLAFVQIRFVEKLSGPAIASIRTECEYRADSTLSLSAKGEYIFILDRSALGTNGECRVLQVHSLRRLGRVQYSVGQSRYSAKDYASAAVAWTSACASGVLDACNNLGYLTYNGVGTQRNYTEGIRLWRFAAERGVPESQVHLADAYADGKHLRIDLIEAYAWAKSGAHFASQIADQNLAIAIDRSAQSSLVAFKDKLSTSQRKLADERATAIVAMVDGYWEQRLK